MTRICDVSHWDGTAIAWPAVAQAFSGVYIKATEADAYTDPVFAHNWAAAKAAGMMRGPYHFFRHQVGAVAQARYFALAVPDDDPGEFPPCLDIEDTAAHKGGDLMQAALDCAHEIEAQFHRKPLIYTGGWYWNPWMLGTGAFADYALWVADYSFDPAIGPRAAYYPKGFPVGGWRFHQFTDRGAPISDQSTFHGDFGDLEEWAHMTGAILPAPLKVRVEYPAGVAVETAQV